MSIGVNKEKCELRFKRFVNMCFSMFLDKKLSKM